MRCRFAIDDGAYVLGALSPTDRSAFERHLPACGSCREAVTALAVLPGLLGRLDAAAAAPSGPTVTAAASSALLERTLAAAAGHRRADRRRRTWFAFGAGIAAVIIAIAVGAFVYLEDRPTVGRTTDPLTAMEPVGQRIPVTAELGLTATDVGTRIVMRCRYDAGYDGVWMLRLVVYARAGGAGEQVGTWTARSGQEVSVEAMTHMTAAEIGRVELQRQDGSPLLTWAA